MVTGRYGVSPRRIEPCARFEAAGEPHALAAALRMAGLPLPSDANTAVRSPAGWQVAWLGPRRFVVTGPIRDELRLQRLLHDAFSQFVSADVCCSTDMVACFELAGPGAASVLAQGTALDVSDAAFAAGSATVTDLWGVAAVVERPTQSPLCRVITVDRSLAGFIEGWLRTADGLPSSIKPGVMRSASGAAPLPDSMAKARAL